MENMWAIIRSAFYSSMNKQEVGFEAVRPAFRIEKVAAQAYAMACQDTNQAYFREQSPLAHPIYASRVLRDVLSDVLFNPRLRVNMVKLVHAEQSFCYAEPLRVGMELVPRAKVAAVRDVSSGAILDIDVWLTCEGREVVTGRSSMFIRGKGKKTGESKKEPKAPEPEMSEVGRFTIEKGQPLRYAAASGDYNPIHTSKFAAKLAGFDRPIAHGLCVMAMTCGELVRLYGQDDPSGLAEISLRFSRPVVPGRELAVKTAPEDGRVRFGVESGPGKWAINNGVIRFR